MSAPVDVPGWPRRAGALQRRPGARCVLIVGHAAGPVLCGAERSLLDLLDGFRTIGIDTVVAIPAQPAPDPTYVADLTARSTEVVLADVPWRHTPSPPDPEVVLGFAELIDAMRADAVAVNSIVVREPLVAARERCVPAVVHAREIPQGAPDLCTRLGGAADEVVASVLTDADWVVTSSRCAALAYPARARGSIVPCVVDPAAFGTRERASARPAAGTPAPPRVALVGSVTAAKGVPEFIEVARRLRDRTDAHFVIVGDEVEAPADLAGPEGLPDNVEVTGPLPSPQDAMAQADIVVSASRSTEAFSRVVLEAMASSLPVVAFAHGGPTELVVEGVTGYLVPPGDLDALAARVAELCDDAGLRRRFGEAGRARAVERFTPEHLAVALASTYMAILPGPDVLAARADDHVLPLPLDNRSHFADPFFVGNRARFATTTDVAFLSDTRLVAASLLGRRMYLIGLDPETGSTTVIDEVPTCGTRGEVSIDLIDTDHHGRIATSDCEASSVSLYRVDGDRIERSTTIEVRDARAGYCHGVALVPGRPDVVAACITTEEVGVHLVATADGRTLHRITDGDWIPKSAAFLTDRIAVVAWVGSNISDRPHDHYDAKVTLTRLSRRWDRHRTLATHHLPGTSLDGIRHRHGVVFASAQGDDAIVRFRVGRRSLRRLPDLVGFHLPHGVDRSPDGRWLAVASYGDDAVVLRRPG